MSKARRTSPPPYFWKVPAPEKDHMTENYRRMKNIAVEGQKKRSGPLKANFIPGVTKNSKYAHIQSKVSASLRAPARNSFAEDFAGRRLQQSQKFVQNGNHSNVPGGRPRPSRSSHDLRSTNQHDPFYEQEMRQPRKEVSVSASNVNSRPVAHSTSQPALRILQAEPPDESIYKWRFNDSPPLVVQNGGGDGDVCVEDGSQISSSKYPVQQVHRVEYLPCDGICAEENHGDETNLDSARSNSSRTSRGCNTEETRIIGERGGAKSAISFSLRGLNLNTPCDSEMDIRRVESQPHLVPHAAKSSVKQKGPFTHSNGNGVEKSEDLTRDYGRFGQHVKRNRSSQSFDIITGDDLDNGMKALKVQSVNKNKPGSVSSTPKGAAAGDLPHSLGTVPKYLKQRQQEWKVEEEAKQEAQKNSHVPAGFISLTEAERLDHLREFKKNYDSLISELNRIPITIDTIRVREHKNQIEQKLTRLEEAMKNFSRPVVWIKADT